MTIQTLLPEKPKSFTIAEGFGEQGDVARIEILAPISIIIPTYKERENLPFLIDRIDGVRKDYELTIELLLIDDQSNDGSREWVDQCEYDWITLIERCGPRGLSPAVLDGIKAARHHIVVVMDADLSHPPEKIPYMLLALQAGQQMVIGSRYVSGGFTDDSWGFFRWFNSLVATFLAKPLTKVSDPMAGFFAFRKTEVENCGRLNPIGYKIALELIVKCRMTNIGEVPIHFANRIHGESKLSLREQINYLQHIRRLYIFKFGAWSHFAQFLFVGATGIIVNLLVIYALVWMSAPENFAIAGGIMVSLISNFLLNRRFSFSYARHKPIVQQFIGYTGACLIGAVVNYSVAMLLRNSLEEVPLWLAALCGIVAGTIFNFLISRFLVFSSKSKSIAVSP